MTTPRPRLPPTGLATSDFLLFTIPHSSLTSGVRRGGCRARSRSFSSCIQTGGKPSAVAPPQVLLWGHSLRGMSLSYSLRFYLCNYNVIKHMCLWAAEGSLSSPPAWLQPILESRCGSPCLRPDGFECPNENRSRTTHAAAREHCSDRCPQRTRAAFFLLRCPRHCLQSR